jgi:hypothetical protein
MKKLIMCLLIVFTGLATYAQSNSDSLAYQLQRKKINSMLQQRRDKFGQYIESLDMRTGIFGLQTKNDIRHSNEILMDVVKTDDDIFRQLKILLDYRIFEQAQVQYHAKDMEARNLGFMTTINKLRNELDRVKTEAAEERKQQETLKMILFIVIGVTIVVSIFCYMRKNRAVKS